ncbi:MAG: GH3 auxin-responsive promoter family protein, partial [Candidatus Obscuribacterales bacterium]|nr:GH3 auxin-responsive promoter family protein [Candidatus Obscuribacterales bacterium]
MLRKALYSAYSLLAKPTIEALENASRNPRKAQASRLSQILGNNSSTVFGKEHRFQSISSGSDYARAVPIRDYEEFRPYIEPVTQGQKNILTAEDPFMFATTSGTTGQPKYVPITDGFMHEYRQASIVSGYLLYKYFPGIARGMALSMISPAEEGRLESGIPYGAMTGAIYQKEPLVVKKFIAAIPYEASLINDYESRYYTILRIAIENPISLFYTPNPSTISLLARRLKQYAQRLIADLNDGTLTPPSSLPQTIKDAIMPSIGQ